MEGDRMIPSGSHTAMQPYEPAYESDTSSSSSSGSTLPHHGRSHFVDASMFIDATIAQDDTQGQTAEQQQLLADLGKELARQGIGTGDEGGEAPSIPAEWYREFSLPRHRRRRGRHMRRRIRSRSSSSSSLTDRPNGGRGRPAPPHPFGDKWMPDKANPDSPWRRSLARHRSSADTYNIQTRANNDASTLSSEVLAQEGPNSATTQLLSSSGPMMSQSGATDTGNETDNRCATNEVCRGSDDSGAFTSTKSKERGGEAAEVLSPDIGRKKPESDSRGASTVLRTPPEGPVLAEALAGIADRYLKLDVLDHSQDTSQYIGYLLDTIHSLESKLYYKGARDVEKDDDHSDSDSDNDKTPATEETKVPRSQVLHRVTCSVSWHDHTCLTYEDEPRHPAEAGDEYKGLCGKIEVPDVGYYVEQRPAIAFVVIKKHGCGQVTRLIKDDDRVSDRMEKIKIVSAALDEAFKHIAEFEPYQDDSDDDDDDDVFLGGMEAPYLFLFHHYQKLQDLAEEQRSYKPILDPLIRFLEQNYSEEYRSANELFQRGFVTAYHSTKLYKPLEALVVRENDTNTLRAGVLKQLPAREPGGKKKLVLDGWSWSYNGQAAKREAWRKQTDTFQAGEVPINKLRIHPLRYAKPKDVEKLRETGRRFWDMRRQGLRCYTGWDKRRDRYYSNERFMVDVATYLTMYKFKGHKADEDVLAYDKWPLKIHATQEMPQDCELFLPDFIEGFHLDSKKWVVLNIGDFLPRVDWNKSAFRQLVLDEKTKEMIHALVDVQKSRDRAMDDIIKGKGTGLILLLHGSPGTGKTLTAESVAEIAEKPLYRVTCGDIGTDAQEVERYLQTVLYLGKIWDCGVSPKWHDGYWLVADPKAVLLLDEADVFLEERTMADLARNSLVSVFLRILEYHQGILILTSNRVGTFDEAFKSRIQVAIHYDNLTKKSRKAIWRNFFDMIEESEEDANMPELERRLNELAEEEMNGRQIRNALLTARQLAQHRKERLDWEHLNQVIKTSAAFNKYLKTVKGHTDDRWAREEGIR